MLLLILLFISRVMTPKNTKKRKKRFWIKEWLKNGTNSPIPHTRTVTYVIEIIFVLTIRHFQNYWRWLYHTYKNSILV